MHSAIKWEIKSFRAGIVDDRNFLFAAIFNNFVKVCHGYDWFDTNSVNLWYDSRRYNVAIKHIYSESTCRFNKSLRMSITDILQLTPRTLEKLHSEEEEDSFTIEARVKKRKKSKCRQTTVLFPHSFVKWKLRQSFNFNHFPLLCQVTSDLCEN